MRWGALVAVVLLALASCTSSASDPHVVLHVYDSAGEELSWAEFRDVQSNGWGERGYNDVLLEPSDLTIIKPWPLFERNDNPTLKSPGQPALLAFAWPSASGYSQLLLPVPEPGTHNLNLLVAEASVEALDDLRNQHPDQPPSADAEKVIVSAEAALKAAHETSDEVDAAIAADSAHDAAVRAEVLLLQQYGQGKAGQRRAVTLDRPATDSDLQRVVDLTGTGGWVRMVLDFDTPLTDYQGPLRRAQELGLQVMLQPVDSSGMAELDETGWRQRWQDAVATLPEADEWETGNEVNGGWLGEQVAERVTWATRYVHDHTDATALVTVYWQLGEAEPKNATFDWLAAHPEAVAEADTIGLSIYPEEHPLGAATDRVLRQLHATIPGKPIVISELGYWVEELDHIWWWGDESDPLGDGRASVAGLYTRAISASDFGDGGPFWWSFLSDAPPGSPLAEALSAAWG